MKSTVQILLLITLLVFSVSAVAVSGNEVENRVSGSDVMLLVAYVLLALVVSFMCSIAEAVLLSVTPSFIEGLRDKKPKLFNKLKKLKQEYLDRSIAAILTLNTIAHTIGAIGAGSKATAVFGNVWFGMFSAVMTLLILFLSEIIPKTLGAMHWVVLTRPVMMFIQGLIYLLFPLVWISEQITRVFSSGRNLHVFNRDELIAMARLGEQTGTLDGDESRIIYNLFQFNMLNMTDIMTPRTVITALSESISIGEAFEQLRNVGFSRLPVYDTDLDNVTGFVLKEDILLMKLDGKGSSPLRSLRRQIHVVPDTISLQNLFKDLLILRRHIALVIDEYGGTSGLVTLEDLVETLVGQDIMDETDTVQNMQELAREKWIKRRDRKVAG